MRLIDADALKAESFGVYDSNGELRFVVDVNEIDEQPTVDAVRVVRCGECKHYGTAECDMEYYGNHMPEDWYCADGERR